MVRPAFVSLVLAVVTLATPGCGNRYGALRRRASTEMSCDGDALAIRPIGAGGYRVLGCGREMTYTCSREVCIPTSGGDTYASSPSSTTSASTSGRQWPDAVIRQMLLGVHDEVLACFSVEHVPATVRLIVARSGAISQHAIVSESTTAEQQCAAAIFDRVHLADGPFAPRRVVLAFAPHAQEIGAPSSVAAEPWDVEGSMRAELDAHAGSILVCTSGTSVAVLASWTAEGALTFTLRGRFAGSPEEGCVRQALAGVTVAAHGRGGTVLHPIEPP
jgi:hypothetical protein